MSSNPFATRYIRPGALEYIFPPGTSAESFVETLRQNKWFGQIIGPHGSGKSTLVAAIIPALQSAGRNVIHYPIETQLDATTQLVVDGYEQLSWLQRRSLLQRCKKFQAGLLVTAHRDMHLPPLVHTEPSLELTRAVVTKLLLDKQNSITSEDIASAYQQTGGNIRETLFRLFDVYQERSQRSDVKAEN